MRSPEHPDGQGEEKYLLCRSTERAKKEEAMLQRQLDRLGAELAKIERCLQRKAQPDIAKVERRIGRWLGKYPAAAKLVTVEVQRDEESAAAIGLHIHIDPGKRDWAQYSHGA